MDSLIEPTSETSLGVLMLETDFPRIVGDIGNVKTWPFPVIFHEVKGASVTNAVFHQAEGFLEPFLEAAEALIDRGVSGIATGCGFLSLMQNELAAALPVPVATSSLMQAAAIDIMLPEDQCVGIVTISDVSLTEHHLKCAGVPEGVPIVGTRADGELASKILGNKPDLNVNLARKDVVEAANSLVFENSNVGAILLECTNMAPYANAVRLATNLPVFSIYTFLNWFHSSLSPRRFTQ